MKKVLVCTDGSLYSPSIYKYARWAAASMGLGLRVLHCIEREEQRAQNDLSGSLGFRASAELMEELVQLDEAHGRVARLRGEAILKDAAAQMLMPDVVTTQRHGALVDAVSEFREETELIVIGKRGEHADFSEGHLGSNLERVVRTADLPVLVAAREFRPIEKVTLAFDGGKSSLKAVHYLATKGLAAGASCEIVAVGESESDVSGSLGRGLAEAVTVLEGAGFQVKENFLFGDIEERVGERVAEEGSDLLVMGAFGHSKVRQFILGSTTSGLIRTCQVPVLLFR